MITFKKLDIEIFSYCNRRCAWCPNSKKPRDFFIELDDEYIIKILTELKENNMVVEDPIINLFRFNEPLFKLDILNRKISLVKEILPKSTIVINTNGDYKEKIFDCKADVISIMDYDNKGKDYWLDWIDDFDNYYFKNNIITYKNIRIKLNWSENNIIESRAGILDVEYERTKSCMYPSFILSIDYNGNVLPCCHYIAEFDIHKDYIFGNIKTENIKDIIKGEYSNFTKDVGECKFNKFCKGCSK